jgi:hypothetical protein
MGLLSDDTSDAVDLKISTDFGRTWTTAASNVGTASWASDAELATKAHTMLATVKEAGTWTLYKSHDLFATKKSQVGRSASGVAHRRMRRTKPISRVQLTPCTKFDIYHSFVYAEKILDDPKIALYISTGGSDFSAVRFAPAVAALHGIGLSVRRFARFRHLIGRLGFDLLQVTIDAQLSTEAYRIVDSSEEAVFLYVDEGQALFVSNEVGRSFKKMLRGVMCSVHGFCDVIRVQGTDGAYIANVDNGHGQKQSVVTHDMGATWRRLEVCLSARWCPHRTRIARIVPLECRYASATSGTARAP